MAESIFLDKAAPPTEADMAAAVGAQRKLWDSIAEDARTTYGAVGAPHMYGPKYGWCLRFLQGKRMLVLLWPQTQGFRVCVNLSREAILQALELPLGKKIRAAVESAPAYAEGCPVYVEVATAKDAKDIRALMALKGKMKKSGKQNAER